MSEDLLSIGELASLFNLIIFLAARLRDEVKRIQELSATYRAACKS